MRRKGVVAAALALALAGCTADLAPAVDAAHDRTIDAAAPPPPPPPADANLGAWRLVWQDEFEGPAGTLPDRAHWTPEIGGHGWGNGELQFYTDRPSNASLDGAGNLALVARREDFGGRQYTSARLITRDGFWRKYGRFEARMKLPTGQGLWPAFWMLGTNFGEAGWPECGEIDVMEMWGHDPQVVHGSLHGPGYSGGDAVTKPHEVSGPATSQRFRVYAVEWFPGRIAWFVDDVKYFEVTSGSIPDWGTWVYDHPFFLILNVAVGGTYAPDPTPSTPFPQSLLVDYVRVYEAVP